MKSDRGAAHAAAALNRLLDPLHPCSEGEARRQLKRLTAIERTEVTSALMRMRQMLIAIDHEPLTEIDWDIDHKAIRSNTGLLEYNRYGHQIPVRFSRR